MPIENAPNTNSPNRFGMKTRRLGHPGAWFSALPAMWVTARQDHTGILREYRGLSRTAVGTLPDWVLSFNGQKQRARVCELLVPHTYCHIAKQTDFYPIQAFLLA